MFTTFGAVTLTKDAFASCTGNAIRAPGTRTAVGDLVAKPPGVLSKEIQSRGSVLREADMPR